MEMNHAAFARSPALRASLKRGLARQAIESAGRDAPDLPGLIRMAADLRPNAKALARLSCRIQGRPGVTRVAPMRDGKGLCMIIRAKREVEARVEGETLFRETGLIYLQARVAVASAGLRFHLRAMSFCAHALERLVERSSVSLDSALLPQVDAEALSIFRAWDRDAFLNEGDDRFCPALANGLWAGGFDLMTLDPDWNLLPCGAPVVPLFSARTFLSPAEMRPTVWLRWRDDPSCRMA